MLQGLTFYQMWDTIALEEQVEWLLNSTDTETWLDDHAMRTWARARAHPVLWLKVKRAVQAVYIKGTEFEAAVAYWSAMHPEAQDAALVAQTNGHQVPDVQDTRALELPGPLPPSLWEYHPLPAAAMADAARAAEASPWLDDYIAFSQHWSPWGYHGFHEAVALWMLATIAARRIRIHFGPTGLYTSLYLALISRSSLYAKSTTVQVGVALLRQAGLSWLLADDDATPQAFVRGLTMKPPSNYAVLPQEEQEMLRKQLAFAAQRGWFFEEWGQHLDAMMHREGPMAGFRGMLRRLDDHQETLYL